MNPKPLHQRGFTLLEMALTLFTVGFLLAALPQLIQDGSTTLASAPGTEPGEAAELALKGFVLARNRLPCPTNSPDLSVAATENCTLPSGFLPFKALQLAQPVTNAQGYPFAYGVLQGANHLGQATAKFTPTYLKLGSSYYAGTGTETSSVVNGLDFCAKLRDQAQIPFDGASLQVDHWDGNAKPSRNPAWVLVDPGGRNADGNTATHPLFAAGNQPGGLRFESPGKAALATYDDKVRAASLTQLYGELRCPTLLAAASAAAREADYALDHWRARSYLVDFRNYERRVREQKKVQADNTLLIQQFNISMTVVGFALDLGIGLASASGAGSIAATLVAGVSATTLAAIGLTDAQDAVGVAASEVTEGQQRESAARTAEAAAAVFRAARVSDLRILDERAWFP
jgi:hypothetical protein